MYDVDQNQSTMYHIAILYPLLHDTAVMNISSACMPCLCNTARKGLNNNFFMLLLYCYNLYPWKPHTGMAVVTIHSEVMLAELVQKLLSHHHSSSTEIVRITAHLSLFLLSLFY